jgi:hypothetical protein
MPSRYPTKRGVVDDCLSLWIHKMPKGRNILRWKIGESEVASLEYERSQDEVHIRAQVISLRPQSRSVGEHRFKLEATTQPDNNGIQQWFTCECGRRTCKLFLPIGKTDFRCSHCHNLTHRSAQIRNSRMERLIQRPDELARALVSRFPRRRMLALKATIAMSCPNSPNREF